MIQLLNCKHVLPLKKMMNGLKDRATDVEAGDKEAEATTVGSEDRASGHRELIFLRP